MMTVHGNDRLTVNMIAPSAGPSRADMPVKICMVASAEVKEQRLSMIVRA